jgi:hypothetical protein
MDLKSMSYIFMIELYFHFLKQEVNLLTIHARTHLLAKPIKQLATAYTPRYGDDGLCMGGETEDDLPDDIDDDKCHS